MKKLLIWLPILMTFLGNSSCSGIDFNPDVALPNISKQHLVHEDGRVVPFQSNKMKSYACMHETKWRELSDIINSAGANQNPAKDTLGKVISNQE